MHGKQPKILIVDDDATSLQLMVGLLRAEGFLALTASDGRAARVLARNEQPDLILLDVMMPDESGFETCATLKSERLTADIPIIFLSAMDDVRSKVKGLKTGAVDYVSKPVDCEEILARVRVHLRIRQTNRAIADEHRARLQELRRAQQAILVRPEDYPHASFAVYYEPLEDTGGDFYDVVTIDSGIFGYFVADVSGHGPGAAFLTSAVKALLRQYTGPLFSPEDTLRGLDSVMTQMLGEEQYLTACYAQLNRRSRRLSVVSAGHPPLILVTRSGKATAVEVEGDPLGIFGSLALHRKDLPVSPGDRFFLYTDGLIESSAGGERQSGLARLMDACVSHRANPLAASAERIAACVQSRGAPVDDLLLLAVEVPE